MRVVSLQHDGIVAVVRMGEESDRAAEGMAKEATAAVRIRRKVIPKPRPEFRVQSFSYVFGGLIGEFKRGKFAPF